MRKHVVLPAVLMAAIFVHAGAQTTTTPTTTAPATDTSAQASPEVKAPATPATDTSAQASPAPPAPHGDGFAAHTAIAVRMLSATDSAHAHNGDTLHGKLAAAVRTRSGHVFPAGTDTVLTVISVAPVGKLASSGEITLQVVRIGSLPTLTSAITIKGQPGPKDLPDSAPAKGTEASVPAGTVLHVEVSPVPL
jgi:hypothetical protein